MRISDWSSDVCSSDLSPFFRALLTEATRQGGLTMRTGRDMWLNALILNEFGADVRPEKYIVTPRDSRLMTICHAILANPEDNRTIDAWTSSVGMSRPALTSNFSFQTALRLAVRRQHPT